MPAPHAHLGIFTGDSPDTRVPGRQGQRDSRWGAVKASPGARGWDARTGRQWTDCEELRASEQQTGALASGLNTPSSPCPLTPRQRTCSWGPVQHKRPRGPEAWDTGLDKGPLTCLHHVPQHGSHQRHCHPVNTTSVRPRPCPQACTQPSCGPAMATTHSSRAPDSDL